MRFLVAVGTFGLSALIYVFIYIRYFRQDNRPVAELWREWRERKDP